MTRAVWISDVACITPLGDTTTTYEGVRVAASHYSCYTDDGYTGDDVCVGRVPLADRKVRGVRQPRARGLARAAVEMLDASRLIDLDALIVGTALGATSTPIEALESHLVRGRRLPPWFVPHGMTNSLSAGLAIDLGFTGRLQQLAAACASGASALATGAELIRHGMADRVLVVAADAIPHWAAVQGFSDMQAMAKGIDPDDRPSRPFDQTRQGFVLSEGAAAILLSAERQPGPAIQVVASAQTNDAHSLVAPEPEGVAAASMLSSLAGHLSPTGDVLVSMHGTSTPLNDEREARIVFQVLGDRAQATAFKGAIGHAMGACGLIETVLACRSLVDQVIPPIAGLRDPIDVGLRFPIGTDVRPFDGLESICQSFGFGGQNCANLLRLHDKPDPAGRQS